MVASSGRPTYQRPAEVAELLGQPAFDEPVPAAYAERSLAVRAQQAVPVEGVERAARVLGLGVLADP